MPELPHGDVVGSLLRPAGLIDARKSLAKRKLSTTAYKQIENRAVDQSIALQHEVGLEIITDGEMRRLSFQSLIPDSVDGFGTYDLDAFLWGDWHGDRAVGDWSLSRPQTLGVVKKLHRKQFLSIEEFRYLRDRTDRIPKITLPSPSLFANFWSPHISSEAYPTLDDFLSDVAGILREEISELAKSGATYIQLDAPHYMLMLDPKWADFYAERGWTASSWLGQGVNLDNEVIKGFSSITFALHL